MKELVIFNNGVGKNRRDIKIAFKYSKKEDVEGAGDLFCISPKDRIRVSRIEVMG